MPLTNPWEAAVLEYFFSNGTNASAGANVGISTSDPGDTGSVYNEPVSGGYGRTSYNQANWAAASNGSISNSSDKITFPTTTGDWGTISHFFIANSGTIGAGELRYYGTCSKPVLGNNEVPIIAAGALSASFSGLFAYSGANAALDNLFKGSTTVNPGTLYFALSTTTPLADETNFTEPVGGSYARVAITADTTFWGTATQGDPTTLTNSAGQCLWPEASGSWGTLTYWGIYSAATSGSLYAFGALDSSQAIVSGDQVKFGLSDLTLTLD